MHEPGEVFLATSRREAPLILNDESEGPVIALYRLTSRVWQRISRHFSVMQYRKWSRRREAGAPVSRLVLRNMEETDTIPVSVAVSDIDVQHTENMDNKSG